MDNNEKENLEQILAEVWDANALRTITVSPEELEALGYVLDLAHGDQQSYLDVGSPSVDYGDDWPNVSRFKAEQFRAIAQFANRLGLHGELERWNALAEAVQS